MMMFHTRRLTSETVKDVAELRRLLRLDPEATDIQITYGADAQSNKEIALHTRSGYQVLIELASFVSVPPEHVTEHRTAGYGDHDARGNAVAPAVRVDSKRNRAARRRICAGQVSGPLVLGRRQGFSLQAGLHVFNGAVHVERNRPEIQQPILTIRAN